MNVYGVVILDVNTLYRVGKGLNSPTEWAVRVSAGNAKNAPLVHVLAQSKSITSSQYNVNKRGLQIINTVMLYILVPCNCNKL